MGVVFCARSGVSGRVCSGLGVSWYWMPPPNALMVVVRGRAWALQVSAWPDACVVLALFGVGV